MTAAKWVAALAAALFVVSVWSPTSSAQVSRRYYPLTFGTGDTTAVGMADSCGYKDTRHAQRIWLWLKPSRPCRIAIAVYEGGIHDSSAVVNPDTSKVAVWPWSGARELTTVAAPNDSLVMRETLYPKSDQAASYEMLVTFADAGVSKWGSPRGRWIALHSPISGEWYTGNYTNIRVRNLSGVSGTGGVVTWTGSQLRCVAW